MKKSSKIKAHQKLLLSKYKLLMEEAYNLRQTDSAQSDISEYKALKLLHRINKLKYLNREHLQVFA
ncbi:MAG: Lacal_2735 family protein [Flavobacteriaceae bacterium]|nr:Lacal_2735 family protein [Flavobacteriaceae bacterium]